MRFARTITVLSAAAAGSAFLVSGGATAAQPASATGGGQIEFSTDGGAGNTIAFTAKPAEDGGDGMVQYVNREEEDQAVRHGEVLCVVIDPTDHSAHISGRWRDDNSPFALYVQDNGEGNSTTDMIAIEPINDVSCTDDAAKEAAVELGRGNVQVRPGG